MSKKQVVEEKEAPKWALPAVISLLVAVCGGLLYFVTNSITSKSEPKNKTAAQALGSYKSKDFPNANLPVGAAAHQSVSTDGVYKMESVMGALGDTFAPNNEPVQAPKELTREGLQEDLYLRLISCSNSEEVKAHYLARVLGVLNAHPEISVGKIARVANLINIMPTNNQNNALIIDAEVSRLELQAAGLLPEIKTR